MEVTLEEVKKIFLDVLEDRITREEADRWAYTIVRANEIDNVTFLPQEDIKLIWAGVMYLYGIDIKESPNEYLHSKEDIWVALKEKLGG